VTYSPRVRVAFVGKGGAGKSTIAGTFARVLAATGAPVLALDSDPMPGMARAIGVASVDEGIPDGALQEYSEAGRRRFRLRAGLTASGLVQEYAVVGPDDVRFLQLGKARGATWANAAQHAAFQNLIAGDLSAYNIVGDLPAGTRQPFQGWARYADVIMVVAEPTAASVLSGRRLARLTDMDTAPRVLLVANRVREPADAEQVARRTGLPLLGSVPFDGRLGDAARTGRAPVDHDPHGPAVRAVASLVQVLLSESGPP
jgi:CO dehydrogenase maturation factor